MPELPEVETIAVGVNERVRGERIEQVWVSDKREPFKTPATEMAEGLKGRRIEKVARVGKHIVLDLEPVSEGGRKHARIGKGREAGSSVRKNPASSASKSAPAQWIVHLGMTGRLLVCAADVPVPPHTHAQLRLSSGRELRFVDARRFGRLALRILDGETAESGGKTAAIAGQGRFAGPGREPLTISEAEFAALFHKRKLAIKAALLNQGLLHGVGNIYADESLFRAGIRPKRMAARLTGAELAKLHASVQSVLREAIKLGGSSVSDYVDADGVRGFFQLEHRVYMRTGKPCLVCGTTIRRIVLTGRGTHYCPRCQR